MQSINQLEVEEDLKMSKAEKLELYLIIGVMIASAIFFPLLKGIIMIASIAYFLVEQRVRKRLSQETAFSFSTLPHKLFKNWHVILLVGVIMQFFYLFVYTKFFPEVLHHVLDRVPLNFSDLTIQLFLSIVLLAFGEEIVFRGLIQARLNRVMPTWMSILFTSLLFVVMHISTGEPYIVVIDLMSVFLDSLLFGIIFARTKNIYASTIAHILANTIAMLSIIFFITH